RDAHFIFVRKSADVAEAALGFEVEIDDVLSSHATVITG
ncbi:MAG: hypothetical protein RLZZ282_446, partial [Verrucomicrobiota bacterium]